MKSMMGLGRENTRAKRGKLRPRHMIALSAISLGFVSIGWVFAAPTTVPAITFQNEDAAIPDCLAGSQVRFTYSVSDTNVTTIASVTVEGINTSCDGRFFALALIGTNSTLLDEIVWELDSVAGNTSISAIANGTLTSSSNGAVSNVYRVYPSSQTDPEGLDTTIQSSSLIRVEVEILPATRAARG